MAEALAATQRDLSTLAARVDVSYDQRLAEARSEASRVVASVLDTLGGLTEEVRRLALFEGSLRDLAERITRLESRPVVERDEVRVGTDALRREAAALAEVVRRLPTHDTLRPLLDRLAALELTTTSLATTTPRELGVMRQTLTRRYQAFEEAVTDLHRKLDG